MRGGVFKRTGQEMSKEKNGTGKERSKEGGSSMSNEIRMTDFFTWLAITCSRTVSQGKQEKIKIIL